MPSGTEAAHLSTLFVTPKHDGTARVIFNLKTLNEFVEAIHFKMDTVKEAILLMTPGCYFASVDFKHAYFSVSVAKKDRKFLCFKWNGELFQFTALPQGLRSAPQAFTKLMKPPFAYLREQGYTCLGYIDDSLFIGKSPGEVQAGVYEAVQLFDNLGLTVHIQKSVLGAVQKIEYLGFELNSVDMTVSLTVCKKEDW